jgi:hypothetical protein
LEKRYLEAWELYEQIDANPQYLTQEQTQKLLEDVSQRGRQNELKQ